MKYTRILTICFNEELEFFEIPLFRGAILHLLGEQADTIFHNHIDEGFNYKYPLIQYKCIRKRAAIVCVNEGADLIGKVLSKGNLVLTLGERVVELTIAKVIPQRVTTQIWDTSFKYHIHRWLPLNKENYMRYRNLETEIERLQLLERVLTSHLIAFLKGIGIWVEQKVECHILNSSEPYLVRNKEVKLMAFNVDFKTNLSLPDFVGIGKNSSIGYGIISHISNNNNSK